MTDRQNVVLVTVDSLRADHCGYMGYGKDTTPTLDQMADEGIAFTNAIAPGPSTYNSMPAVFTGRHMAPHVAEREIDGDSLDRRTRNIELNMNRQTIAEWFDQRGYTTGAFTTNPYTGKHTAFARGFDDYEDFMGEGEGLLMQKAAHVPVLSELKHLVTLVRGDRASMQWTDYYEKVAEWLDTATEPFFLWLFLLDTHTPYLANEQFRTETGQPEMYYRNWKLWLAKKWLDSTGSLLNREGLVSLYDDTIRAVDAFLERLLTDLNTDTAVVVHADHGEAFGEHGTYGHQDTLYEENVHVPLLVHGPGVRSETVSEPTSLITMPDLLRHLSNRKIHDTQPALPTVTGHEQGEQAKPRFTLTQTGDGQQVALRTQNQKYIATLNSAGIGISEEETYDLTADRTEQTDITAENADFVSLSRQVVRQHIQHGRECVRLTTSVDAHLNTRSENPQSTKHES